MSRFLSGAVRAVLIFACWLVLVAAVYRRTPSNFLRAESGWYLWKSHSSEDVQRNFRRDFFGSYGGHFTPLAFLAEFQTAKLIGTNDSFWKWRQIVTVALVGAALCGVIFGIGEAFHISRATRWALAAGLTATTLFRPEMVEFIGWPFLILQLLWIGLFILAMSSVAQVATAPEEKRWPWLAALFACLSIQVSGLGLATVAAVAAAFSGILIVAARAPNALPPAHRKRIATALLAMLGIALLHGGAMLYFLEPHPPRAMPILSLCRLLLGFTANLFASAARGFTATAILQPDWRSLGYAWPYGLMLISGALLLLVFLFRRTVREPTARNLVSFSLHTLTISAFLALIGLSAVRQLQAASLDQAAGNLTYTTILPRYVVPLHFLVIGSAIAIAGALAKRAPRVSLAAFWALGVAALVAQIDFRSTTFGYVEPLSRISHRDAWQGLLATVRECRAAHLPVPKIPLGTLTQGFFEADAESLECLWREDLKLKPQEKIEMISWEQYLAGDRGRYRNRVPSLHLLEQKLELPDD